MNTRRTSMVVALATTLALGLASLVTVAAPAANADVHDADNPITFDDVRELVVQLEADGEVTRGGKARLLFRLDLAEWYYDNYLPPAYESRVVHSLEEFKQYASHPRLVLTDSAKDELVDAADQLIVVVCSTPGACE